MAKGLYRDSAGWVKVSYRDRFQMLMKKQDYEDHDYRPRYENLPDKQQYQKPGPKPH